MSASAPATISARTLTLEQIAAIMESHDISVDWYGPNGPDDEWLAVQWERAYADVELSDLCEEGGGDAWRYVTLRVEDGVKEGVAAERVQAFINRVNTSLKVVRASLEEGKVMFDYTVIVTGDDLPSAWLAGCVCLFDNSVRMAREEHDREYLLVW